MQYLCEFLLCEFFCQHHFSRISSFLFIHPLSSPMKIRAFTYFHCMWSSNSSILGIPIISYFFCNSMFDLNFTCSIIAFHFFTVLWSFVATFITSLVMPFCKLSCRFVTKRKRQHSHILCCLCRNWITYAVTNYRHWRGWRDWSLVMMHIYCLCSDLWT